MEYLVIVVLVALAILAVFLWVNDTPDKQSALPPHALRVLASQRRAPVRDDLVGSLMFVAVGTFGGRTVLSSLILLAETGLSAIVGTVLLIENDALERAQFLKQLPRCYLDRLVMGYTTEYSGGFANRSIEWALDHIREWGVPIRQAAQAALDLQFRRNHSRTPQLVLFATSLGGQAALAAPVLDTFTGRLGDTSLIVGFTALPAHERLRGRWPELKGLCDELGLAGWVILDNLIDDVTTANTALAALPVAVSAAALREDQPTALNNCFSLALPELPGGILLLQVVATSAVAYEIKPRPSKGPRYFVEQEPLVVQIHRTFERLAQGTGSWSARLPVYEGRTSTFDFAITSVVPDDLQRVKDAVVAGLRLEADSRVRDGRGALPVTSPRFGEPNYEMAVAAVAVPMADPARPTCPLLAVRLTSVYDGARLVEDIVRVPQARLSSPRSHYLPAGRQPAQAKAHERTVPEYVPPTAAD
ncbi:MAG: hypothetical protein ACYDCQ_16815 [Dehalococcoidia bacterium]